MSLNLNAKLRKDVGKQYAKKIRKLGAIPAVLYGKDIQNKNLELNVREVQAIMRSDKGINNLVNLNVEQDKTYTVLIKAMQGQAVSR